MGMFTIFFLLGLITLTTGAENSCRIGDRHFCAGGWVQHGRKCFKLLTSQKTFEDADASCKTNQALLASIGSQVEHNFLLDYILRDVKDADLKPVWIGGRKKKTRYIWMDLEPFTYMDWHTGNAAFIQYEVNSCIQLATEATTYETDQKGFGKFLLKPCANKNFYICQKLAEAIVRNSKA